MRALAHGCAIVLLLLSVAIVTPATAQSTSTFGPGHRFVVVTFANDPYQAASRAGTTGRRYTGESYGVAQNAHVKARRVASTYSLREVASWPIKQLAVHCVVYEIPDSRSVAEVLAALTKDPGITQAQPLQEFHTLSRGRSTDTAPLALAAAVGPAHNMAADSSASQVSALAANGPGASGTSASTSSGYNDPLYGLQTNLVALGIAAAHEQSQGAGVRVALIDTGVDTKHPDLQDRIVRTRSFIASASGITKAKSYRHGTAMAGLIAAVANNRVGIVGIAPLARIEVFEACWQLRPDSDEAACNTFTLAQALAAALEAGAPLVNLSIAGPPDPLLSALVQSGLKRGVIFVGSTVDSGKAFPTDIDGVIGVGNSDRAPSAPLSGMTLSAPATHVLTLRPEGQYDFESGTSVAAAEITGIVALLLSADRRLKSAEIVSLLKGTGDVNAALAKVMTDKSNGRLAARSGH